MTTDFVEDQVSVSVPEPAPNRWEARPIDLTLEPETEERERGGIILAAIVALFLPLIIAGAVLIPNTSSSDTESTSNELESIGLDGITVAPPPTTGVSNTDSDEPPAETEPPTDVAGVVETDSGDDSSEVTTTGIAPDDSDDSAVVSATSGAAPSTQAQPPAPRPGADPKPAPSPTTPPPAVVPPTSTAPATDAPTTAPSTTVTPTSTPATTAPPSTAPPTTQTPTTQAPTTQPPDEPDPTAFSQRVEIGQITDTSVRYRFTAAVTTSYAAVVRDEDGIVATSTGTAIGGEVTDKSALGLTPGTDYTIRVRLLGPPEVTSAPVQFRTSGGDPDPADDEVAILDLTVVEVQSTRFVVNYASNICANGSFVIRDVGGAVVGRNNGQDDGCTTRHLAVPGFWTPALEPDTTYVLEITVEADGQGRGNGNTATRTLTVTTRS